MSNLSVENLNLSGNLTTTGNVSCSNLDVTGAITYESVIAQTANPVNTLIEEIVTLSDGRTITTQRGTMSAPDNSSYVASATFWAPGSTAWVDVPGTTFSYTPPTGTKTVHVQWTVLCREVTGNDRGNMIPMIDGTAITTQQQYLGMHAGTVSAHHVPFYILINCGADTDDASAGEFTEWTTDKTLKFQFSEIGGNWEFYRGTYGGEYPNTTTGANIFSQYSWWRISAYS